MTGVNVSWRALVLLLTLACGACLDLDSPDGSELPLVPVDELPWTTPAPMPPCEPFADAFEIPAVAPPTGLVQLENVMPLQPTGVTTWLDVVVLAPGTGEPDLFTNGTITIDPGPDASVVDVTPLVEGRARAAVRFEREGTYQVTATYPTDGRTGVTTLIAYTSQLPIWELAIAPADLEELLADPYERIEVSGVLTVAGVAHPTTLRLHGGSSRDFVKKSFRFDLDPGQSVAGHDHLVLRAEWVDKTLLRNWLVSDMIRGISWLPVSDVQLVHLRINDELYGVMSHVERVDKDFLSARGLRTSGDLFEADPPLELSSPGGNLTPLPAAQYPQVYVQQGGLAGHDDLVHFIEHTLQLPDDELLAVLADEIVIDDVLIYLAAHAVVQNWDHVRKNYYLYRDPIAGEGWRMLPWDLDLTLGHLWSEENDIFEERITVDAEPYVGWQPPLYNALFDRVLSFPALRARFVELAQRFAETALDEAYIDERLDGAMCLATPDLLADARKRGSNEELPGRVDEIRDFAAARRGVIDSLDEREPLE